MPTTATEHPKATGWLFVGAAALLLAGNLAHPVDAEPTHLSRLELAADPSWILVHLAVAAGMLALAAAMVLLARAARDRGAGALAGLLEVVAIVGGGTMAVVFAALDGFGAHALAADWAEASGRELVAVEGAAIALEAIDSGMAAIGTLLLFGAGFAVTGVLVARTGIARHWQGVAAVVVGALGTVTGVSFLFVGATPTIINLLLRPTAMGATLTAVMIGTSLARGSSTVPADVAAPARVT